MISHIKYKGAAHKIDLSKPIDVSIPLQHGTENPNAFYAPPVAYIPLIAGDFVGSTQSGSPVNFFNVQLNPHGNGTHTECVGHIFNLEHTINKTLDRFFFPAQLISIEPQELENGDRVITMEQVASKLDRDFPEALLIRTFPNDSSKKSRQYSGANPPYMHHEAAAFLAENNIEHLLIDLPSVDREEDDGLLLAHHAYWQHPESVREKATISELIYVPDEVVDGKYFLNIQIASFELDVSPSKPVLYEIFKD